MAEHNEIGRKGEDVAVKYLVKKGYKIVCRNWRYKKKELDIVATKREELIVVEVKTRSNGFFQNISEMIPPKKIKFLVEAANEFVVQKKIDLEVRFDIALIIKRNDEFEIEHIKKAFSSIA